MKILVRSPAFMTGCALHGGLQDHHETSAISISTDAPRSSWLPCFSWKECGRQNRSSANFHFCNKARGRLRGPEKLLPLRPTPPPSLREYISFRQDGHHISSGSLTERSSYSTSANRHFLRRDMAQMDFRDGSRASWRWHWCACTVLAGDVT